MGFEPARAFADLERQFYKLIFIIIVGCVIIFMLLVYFVLSSLKPPDPAYPNNLSVWGYLPEWRYEGYDYDAFLPHITHLIFFSLEMDSKGDIVKLDRWISRKDLARAQGAAWKHGTKFLISFGGFGRTNGFPEVVKTKAKRAKFLSNLFTFIEENGLHGVDYHWEYPVDSEVWKGLYLLFEETRLKFGKDFLITVAFYPDQEGFLNNKLTLGNVDFFHMMSYDNDMCSRRKSQSPCDSTLDFAISSTENALRLLPREKLTLGIPFYGRHVHTGDWKTYSDIVREFKVTSTDLDQVNLYYFNNIETIRKKTVFALRERLGGLIVWEAGQDLNPKSDKTKSLFNTITSEKRKFHMKNHEDL